MEGQRDAPGISAWFGAVDAGVAYVKRAAKALEAKESGVYVVGCSHHMNKDESFPLSLLIQSGATVDARGRRSSYPKNMTFCS